MARGLTRRPTIAEMRLWQALRDRQIGGAKFRRQHEVGRFVVDFACVEALLVVEVDGGQHGGHDDLQRERTLVNAGWRVLRFWNNDVLANLEGVLLTILNSLSPGTGERVAVRGRDCGGRPSPPSPQPSPSEEGEGEQ